MSRENSLHLVSQVGTSPRKLGSRRWRAVFQILTVIGMILVLISLVLLLQSLGAADGPQAATLRV